MTNEEFYMEIEDQLQEERRLGYHDSSYDDATYGQVETITLHNHEPSLDEVDHILKF